MNIFFTYLIGFTREERDNLSNSVLKTDVCLHETPDRRVISDPHGNITKVIINAEYSNFTSTYTEIFHFLKNPMRVTIYSMDKDGDIKDIVRFNDIANGIKKLDQGIVSYYYPYAGEAGMIDRIIRGGV